MPGQEQMVEATIHAVVPASNGFVDIKTDQGDFGTKFPEAIAEAQANVGQRVLIAFQPGEPRQNPATGDWYPVRRYFKRVAGSSYTQPQLPQQPQGFAGAVPQVPSHAPQSWEQQAANQGPSPAERDLRIMRQTAAKCAVWTMQLVPSEQRTFQNQLAVAEAWLRYFTGGLGAVGGGNGDAGLTQEQQMAMAGAPQDDIPF